MIDAETAKNFERLKELIDMRREHTDAEWNEFMSLCDWSKGREAQRKEWHSICIESICAGKQ